MADDRRYMGKAKDGVMIPVAPVLAEMSDSYFEFINDIKESIKQERLKIVITANSSMIMLYWNIGNKILEKQQAEGWGAKVIDRLSKDLKDAFPEMQGFSSRNLKYMRKFAECWSDFRTMQRIVAQIPWRSNIVLLDKLEDMESRLWYAGKLIENGWSKEILDIQISTKLIERQGNAINNFNIVLPPADSDLATHVFKDPYLFDFIGTDELRRESELEEKLTRHIEKFLLELGQGFAFVGRQVHLEVGDQDFYIDLLFYHLKLRCYVVIELKACDFEPGYVSQLTMYQNIVDDIFRHHDDKPTIGLLLVKGKNKVVVEYSIAGYRNPVGVAEWQQQLTRELPKDLKSSLPTVEEIEREME
jgi:predicted nuclease of restriction endonuclease-like (RecB) superfamily